MPYKKLQYPTDVKDTDLDAHIRIFMKAIKSNGETVEANIINLFGFTLMDSISKWGATMFKTIQIAHLKSWSKHSISDSEL